MYLHESLKRHTKEEKDIMKPYIRHPGERSPKKMELTKCKPASASHVTQRVGAGRDPTVEAPRSCVIDGDTEMRRGSGLVNPCPQASQ